MGVTESTAAESSRAANAVNLKMRGQIRRFTRKVDAAKQKVVDNDEKIKRLIRDGVTDEKILRTYVKNSMLWEKNHARMLEFLATMEATHVKFAAIADTQQIVADFEAMTKALESMKDMQPEKVEEVMERYKTSLLNAEIVAKTVEKTVSTVTAQEETVDGENATKEVDARLAKIRDETALGVSRAMPEAPGRAPAFAETEEAELARRLAVLRTDEGA